MARKSNEKPAETTDNTTSEAPAQGKVSDAVANIGKNLLKHNPGVQEVYMVSDGLGFYEKNDADNYARTLKNKTVTCVKR